MPIPYEANWWQTVVLSDVTAANAKTFQPPRQQDLYVSAIYVAYTSTGDAGNRNLAVEVLDDDGTTVLMRVVVGLTQAASLTYQYLIAPGMADLTAVRDSTFVTTPLPPTLMLKPNMTLKVYDLKNIAAGDTCAVKVFATLRPS